MKKKSIIILSCVAALCCLALISSHFFDWPVDSNDTSGDIAKSNRFSRKEASEKITNMEELLKNDSAYKNGIVIAHVLMQSRAIQFGALVDMSNEVAGQIPEFAKVLKDMKEAREMVTNVNASLSKAGEDLNAALSGEECPDLTQNTINASLAYTTLQKQNKLANRFIDITDNYLENKEGDDRLKFVRDQWVDYQKMTATIEDDKESAEALAKKGNLLPTEKTLAALESFDVTKQTSALISSRLDMDLGIQSNLSKAIPLKLRNSLDIPTLFAAAQMVNTSANDIQMKMSALDLYNIAVKQGLANHQQQAFSNQSDIKLGAQQNRGETVNGSDIAISAMNLGAAVHLMGVFNQKIGYISNSASLRQSQQDICNQLNAIIYSTSIGVKPEIHSGVSD